MAPSPPATTPTAAPSSSCASRGTRRQSAEARAGRRTTRARRLSSTAREPLP
jgi:hypothetical protein